MTKEEKVALIKTVLRSGLAFAIMLGEEAAHYCKQRDPSGAALRATA